MVISIFFSLIWSFTKIQPSKFQPDTVRCVANGRKNHHIYFLNTLVGTTSRRLTMDVWHSRDVYSIEKSAHWRSRKMLKFSVLHTECSIAYRAVELGCRNSAGKVLNQRSRVLVERWAVQFRVREMSADKQRPHLDVIDPDSSADCDKSMSPRQRLTLAHCSMPRCSVFGKQTVYNVDTATSGKKLSNLSPSTTTTAITTKVCWFRFMLRFCFSCFCVLVFFIVSEVDCQQQCNWSRAKMVSKIMCPARC